MNRADKEDYWWYGSEGGGVDFWKTGDVLKRLRASSFEIKLREAPQRTAKLIGENSRYIVPLLQEEALWLQPTRAQQILGCSSFTFTKYAKLKFFTRQDLRRKNKRRPRYRYYTPSL